MCFSLSKSLYFFHSIYLCVLCVCDRLECSRDCPVLGLCSNLATVRQRNENSRQRRCVKYRWLSAAGVVCRAEWYISKCAANVASSSAASKRYIPNRVYACCVCVCVRAHDNLKQQGQNQIARYNPFREEYFPLTGDGALLSPWWRVLFRRCAPAHRIRNIVASHRRMLDGTRESVHDAGCV